MHALSPESRQAHRILLVDDEADILESLQELLQAAIPGLDVDVAPSGEDALAMLQKGAYDVLVSDFKMPGMNGMDLLREARKVAPGTPRVLMTAFPDLQIAIEAINDARIENFFTKPLDPEEVVDVLEAMLQHRKANLNRDRAFARAMDLARRKEEP